MFQPCSTQPTSYPVGVTWDPEQYGRYAAPRLRPALELLGRVDHPAPRIVYDLGCGRGEMARLMADRWPEARVVGSDTSEEMLAQAAAVASRVEWELQDVATWEPEAPVDVIYANAVLHWVPSHDVLFPRLIGFLAAGGVLAVQMPLSWHEPSHQTLRRVLDEEQLGTAELRASYAHPPVAGPEAYYDLLAPRATTVDIWTTRYMQVLHGADAVLDWVKGSMLRPLFDAVTEDEMSHFLDIYAGRLRKAYPSRPGGETLFPFPRLFIVATR